MEVSPSLAAGYMALKRIYFVRHAQALDRELWRHPDTLRPLTEAGYRQARALATILRRARIKRIVSSPAIRCVDTLWPLADAMGLSVRRSGALYEGAGARRALSLMRRLDARRAALCTHGDVMQEVLELLLDRGVTLPGGVRLAKGSFWTLDLDARGAVVRAKYHRAP